MINRAIEVPTRKSFIFRTSGRMSMAQNVGGVRADPSLSSRRRSSEPSDHTIRTTGFLGAWGGPGDQTVYTAFPDWLTIPSTYDLAGARHWHLTFAWLFVA